MLADRLKTLQPSPTLAMQAKAKAMRAQGIDVISFGAGEPDFDTPRRIKDAAVRAIESGQTKYTEVGGIPELRAAVCQKLKRDLGLEYAPDEVTVSCGAKHTLYNIVMALVNPGDEVLVPSPFWVSYPEQVQLLVTTLAMAVARLWPNVLSNAVDPGWVPTKMGGAGAPDDLGLGHLTQEWLAISEDSDARTSGANVSGLPFVAASTRIAASRRPIA